MVGGQVVLLERVILDVEQKQRGASPVTRRVFGSWKLPLNTQPQVNIEIRRAELCPWDAEVILAAERASVNRTRHE
jgi:hypothetical protein